MRTAYTVFRNLYNVRKMTMKLVLASGSQRRRELLTMCGYDYEIIVSNADETIDENDPESFVRALSFRKAKEVFDRLFAAGRRDFAVIGSDTVVAFKGWGDKARDYRQAQRCEGCSAHSFNAVRKNPQSFHRSVRDCGYP